MEFEGRTVLVTGSSRNIGRATALAFAAQGADIVVNAVQNHDAAEAVAGEITALGRRALVCMADISKEADVRRMADAVSDEFGGVDILVLNASVRPEAPLLDMSYELWRQVIDVQLDGAFFCVRAFLPGMLAKGWGRIITLGGMNAVRGAANRTHASAAKMGLLGITRALAVEVARGGVTVNMVVPGSIDTTRRADDDPTRYTSMGQSSPVGRQGTSEEIAGACLYLASNAAAYVTGQTLHVNGGAFVS